MSNSKKKGGAKPLYTKDVHDTIVGYLKDGAYKSTAAKAAGISVDSLNDWVKLGLAGDPKYRRLAYDVTRLVQEDIRKNQAIITRAAKRDWKAAAWNLERKYPKLYGRAQAQLGVSVGSTATKREDSKPDEASDDSSTLTTLTRFEFYLPANGRRPEEVGEVGSDDDDSDDDTEFDAET